MEKYNTKVKIISTEFVNGDGTFDLESALKKCGHIAGVCYDKEGYEHIIKEEEKKTNDRIELTLNNKHLSIYDQIHITFDMVNIPKMLAMVLNNEHVYTTSEKSARYTKIVKGEKSIITDKEINLYDKWNGILVPIINEKYGACLEPNKIKKLAQENARYMVTVFMPTKMVHTLSLRQVNVIAAFIERYISEANKSDYYEANLVNAMQELYDELDKLNVLYEPLMDNDKNRKFSIFGNNIENKKEIFDEIYQTQYYGSFAQLAQAHRHRTLWYEMQLLDEKDYYIPTVLFGNDSLVDEWMNDITSVKDVYPQGELVLINEQGNLDNFIMKTKERLCTHAQLEICEQTRDTLVKYKKELQKNNIELYNKINEYSRGARCTFPDYACPVPCGFKEGIQLTRKI